MERYTQTLMYENYLLDLEIQQRSMMDYVNECIILSGRDKKKVIEEMKVFNEGAVGDKFKKIWARLKSFFSKIYQKFLENLAAWAEDNIDYLKKYGNIILEKKVKLKSAKMQNHFEGLKIFENLKNKASQFAAIPDLTKLYGHEDKNTESFEEKLDTWTFKEHEKIGKMLGISDIADDQDLAGFSGRLRVAMNGGSDIDEFSGSDLEENMEKMYNFCYQYKSLTEGLQKIKDAFDKGMDTIESSFKKGYDGVLKAINNTDKNKNKDGSISTAAKDNAQKAAGEEGKKAADAIRGIENKAGNTSSENNNSTGSANNNIGTAAESTIYSRVYGNILNEADINYNKTKTTVTSPGSGEDNTQEKPNNTAIQRNNKDAKKISGDINKNVKDRKNDANISGKGNALASTRTLGSTQEDLVTYENNAIAIIRAYANTRSITFGAALNSLSDTRKDYMDIIRAHVRSWLGEVEGPDQAPATKPTGRANIT